MGLRLDAAGQGQKRGRQAVHSSNPGLEYIWREEAARCAAQGRKLEDTFNNSNDERKEDDLFEISCLSAASLEILVFTQASMPDPQNSSTEGLTWVPDEQSLFEELESLVKRSDPDILFGYDTVRLSWGYVLRRATVLGYPDFNQKLGRYPRGNRMVEHKWSQ
ncbi:hypothetical protein TELCIR_17346 [Teladorsagia circumcincta]|uniref:DNA-directed DNA polymerase family B exonuclease domain-containing protein n=1 Tax=Teladorsagia circumcincta TaxID=45464 RepID=A0A2G9TT09_TELCI|nr:hypothetical protein TELCIR_17346 [Teladorsagia circumcincta]